MDYKAKIPRVKIKYISLIILATILFALIILALVTYKLRTKLDAINLGSGAITIIFIVIAMVLPLLIIKLFIEVNAKNPYEELRDKDDLFRDFKNNELTYESDDALIARLKRRKERRDRLMPEVSKSFFEAVTLEGDEDEEFKIPVEEEEEITEIKDVAGDSRFYMLTQIDKEMEECIQPKYDNEVTLKELCERFRNYSAHDLKLYYDIKDIRRFIAGLAVTKLLILQGMSGTGKTSLAYAFGEFLNNKTVVVPIQPMWKERTDLIGYYNEFTKKFNETTLLYKMYEADYTKNVYITVLDEMNIARVEYYFAEFLSLLELPNPDGRNLDVVSDVWDNDPKLLYKGKLRLPINMWFIGTANNDDSTFAISDKVYDRAMVLNLDTKAEVFDGEDAGNTLISIDHLYDLFKKAQKEFEISDRNLRRIKKLDKYMVDTFHITFGNRIMKQIKAYVPVLVSAGGTELDAIDDILSRKVLRKLESKNPVYVRSQSETLMDFIDDLFGMDRMPLCKEAIRQIVQNV
ncbi:MAG: AAA family ATPase [Acholeplasmatales bacterium]|nr:AAA family ATPase [Acholeplasmatales bacterium]